MDKNKIKKANEIIEEIESLTDGIQKLKRNTDRSDVIHFEILQHYGDCRDFERIRIQKKHNEKLFAAIDEIVKELEGELQKINL